MDIEYNKKQYFKDLYKNNPEKNLLERIEYFKNQDIDFYNRKIGFASIVYKNYWVIIPINGRNYAFSVGMNYNFNKPEVMIISDTLSQKEFQILINEINCYIRDKRIPEKRKDYTKEIVIKEEIDFETFAEDDNKPEAQRRIKAKKGAEFKLVNIDKPLIFKEYTDILEEEFPCGYLRNFNYYFTDSFDAQIIVADLR